MVFFNFFNPIYREVSAISKNWRRYCSEEIFFITLVIAELALTAFAIWGIPYFFETPLPEAAGSPMGTGTVKAEVTLIIEEGGINLGDTTQTYQLLRVKLLEGEYAVIHMEVTHSLRTTHYILRFLQLFSSSGVS